MKNLIEPEEERYKDSELEDSLNPSELEKVKVMIVKKLIDEYLLTIGIDKGNIKFFVLGKEKGEIVFIFGDKPIISMPYKIVGITRIEQDRTKLGTKSTQLLFCDVKIGDLFKFTVKTEIP
jgi:hypothetical protein